VKRLAVLSAWALAVGCVSPETSSTTCAGLALEQRLVLLEGDLRTTSGLGAIGRDGCLTEVAGGLALGGDTSLAAAGGRVFVLDRDAGLVHEIDPVALRILRTYPARAPGEERSNPQGVAMDAESRLWVTRFDHPTLAILSGADSGVDRVETLDVGAFADADGLPEMSAIRIEAGRAYVALQQLDSKAPTAIYPPAGPGTVLSIATGDPSDIQPIQLTGSNPFGRFAAAPYDPLLLAVSTPGLFDAISAEDGIDLVDMEAGAARQLVGEPELGGSATEVVLAAQDEAYAIVAGPEAGVNPTRVLAFNPETGEVTRTLVEASGYYHWGLAIAGKLLFVGDRTPGSARILFFDRSTGALAGEIAAQQMAPASILPLP
jgi:hypothetical protein